MSVKILIGDVRDKLRELPDESVHCVVTSPPYWGLRDYGTALWDGGSDECAHIEVAGFVNPKNTLGPNGFLPETNAANKAHHRQFRNTCGHCGAQRVDKQLGLEPTLAEHVAAMVAVFDEVWRVLRKDGTVWMNYGDSYAASVNGRSAHDTKLKGDDDRTFRDKPFSTVGGILKPKDLCGVPWRVAFALQERGWWLRQDIIWAKPNPMPESTRDRCTKAHEYIFLLAKSERYYFDQEAISEPAVSPQIWNGASNDYYKASVGDANSAPRRDSLGTIRVKPVYSNKHELDDPAMRTRPDGRAGDYLSRNKRSVWTIATAPYADAHFATFPPELPELCIKAGCPRGGTVLDPFGGAGTTGLVADRLQRQAILIELNSEYAAMARRRIDDDRGGLLDLMEAAQ